MALITASQLARGVTVFVAAAIKDMHDLGNIVMELSDGTTFLISQTTLLASGQIPTPAGTLAADTTTTTAPQLQDSTDQPITIQEPT